MICQNVKNLPQNPGKTNPVAGEKIVKQKRKRRLFCGMCRISLQELCTVTKAIGENVQILRKNALVCLQIGYRLVYFLRNKNVKKYFQQGGTTKP